MKREHGEVHHNWQWPYRNAFDVLWRLKWVSTIHGLARLVEKRDLDIARDAAMRTPKAENAEAE